MKSLFVDLFKYRARENRKPREDWLTECLCAVLRSLNKDELLSLLDKLAGTAAGTFASAVGEKTVEVSTQVVIDDCERPYIDGKRPDIVLFAGGSPFVVFENKISHGISKRSNGDGPDALDQLAIYGQWLGENSKFTELKPLLVFLTHSTPAPADFGEVSSDVRYGNVTRQVLRWALLAKLLKADFAGSPHTMTSGLIEAFVGILENYGMAIEYPDNEAIQNLERFLRTGSPIDSLVYAMWDTAKGYFNLRKGQMLTCEPNSNIGVYWAWHYLQSTPEFPGKKMNVMVGIWFADMKRLWDVEDLKTKFPSGPQVFVALYDEDEESHFASVQDCPEGWSRLEDSDFIVFKGIAEFPRDPAERAEQIVAWTTNECTKLQEFMVEKGISETVKTTEI